MKFLAAHVHSIDIALTKVAALVSAAVPGGRLARRGR